MEDKMTLNGFCCVDVLTVLYLNNDRNNMKNAKVETIF